jgi:hypothetical protein
MADRNVRARLVDFQPSGSGAPSAASLAALAEEQVIGYLVRVTPELARQWLEADQHNRQIRPTHVRTLAREMTEQRWRATHQGIAFSDHGRLIDGQHRLQAIVMSDVPAMLMVFVDMPDDMFGALDRGARRKHADDIGEDRRLIEPAAWLARVLHRSDNLAPSSDEVRTIFWLYQGQLRAILDASARSVRSRSAAGVRAALAVRLMSASQAHQDLLLAQWEALVSLDVSRMDTTTGALLRRLENVTMSAGHDLQERGAVAWLGFDPTSRGLTKVLVRDLTTTMDTIRAHVQRDLAQQQAQNRAGEDQ